MTKKELQRLSRRELIELLYTMKKNELKLQTQLEQAQQELTQREIIKAQAGSIAEAAMALNGVFQAAQAAADDYLNSIRSAYLIREEIPAGGKPVPAESRVQDHDASADADIQAGSPQETERRT